MPTCMLRDGAELVYADQGAGAPILLVHGWAANHEFFNDLALRLAANRRVIAPTLRAHPGSGRGSAALTIATLGEDIVEFAAALGLQEFDALGWSMGAMALWEAAPRLGARLQRLIVEDMAPRLTAGPSWPHGLAGNYGDADVAATVAEIAADWPAYVARFAPRLFAPGAQESNPELLAWAVEQMSPASPSAMAAFWASMAAQDFRAALAGIAQPMLVIQGRESQVHSDEATLFVANAAPQGARVSIAGAGHAPHLEAPEEFVRNVEGFFRTTRKTQLRSGGATS